jgi:exopolyphosphatase/guanosine-5'-triphosphate,3'-diphosphate pyrophosphatase
MRIAALDLGSNTSLLLIAEVDGSVLKRVLHDETTITRMGQGVHADRRFHPDALARLDACLGAYHETIKKHRCDRVIAVATSAARDVSNGDELLKLGKKHQIPIHIISGQREAQLTFHGAVCDRASSEGLAVIDVGGGSTEIITRQAGVVKGTSVDVGSVRLTELFAHTDPITETEKTQVHEYAASAFARAPLPPGPFQEVVAVAGTPTTLAALEQQTAFQEEKIHGFKMSLEQIESWVERMSRMPLKERAALPGMQPKRADVIVPGSIILASAIRALGKKEVTVSTRGVRYGVALAWQEFA